MKLKRTSSKFRIPSDPTNIKLKVIIPPKKSHLIQSWKSTQIAEQLTLIEFKKYKSILPTECLNKNWTNEKRSKNGKNIESLIDGFNTISLTLTNTVVSF